jgi:MFS family permease
MDPALAGLALIPTTLPMIAVAPLAGRWYDKVGGRPPLVTGFILLALSGVLLAIGVGSDEFVHLLPGLIVYGIGLSLVLSVNDPVSLDEIPRHDHGQASGVSATAEQFGGALGIAVLYSVFHGAYLNDLEARIDESSLPDLTNKTEVALRNALEAAEATGLQPSSFDPEVKEYLRVAELASNHAFTVTFIVVAALALLAAGLTAWLVHKPEGEPDDSDDGNREWQANLGQASR